MSDNNRISVPRATSAGSPPAGPVDAAIVRLLEHPPAVTVPESFAARVAAQAIAQKQTRPHRRVQLGPLIALACAVVLTVALFAFAEHTTASFTSLRFDAELVFLAELGGVSYILSRTWLRE